MATEHRPVESSSHLPGAVEQAELGKAAEWPADNTRRNWRYWLTLRGSGPGQTSILSLAGLLVLAVAMTLPGIEPFLLLLTDVVICAEAFLRGSNDWKSSPQLEAMMDVPAVAHQFRVRILLYSDKAVYGEDQGVLTVMKGGLHFSGQKTDFSVSRHNARYVRIGKPLGQAPRFVVDFTAGHRRRSLGIVALGKSKDEVEKQHHLLRAVLKKWDTMPDSLAWEQTIDPPAKPMPGLVRDRLVGAWAEGIACAGWLLVTVLLEAGLTRNDANLTHVFGPLAFILLGFTLNSWWQTLRTLHVLRKMERRHGE